MVVDMVDRAVLITGAGSGLGRATALLLDRLGSRLALVDRDAEGLDQTVRLIRQEHPKSEPVRFVADVAVEAEVEAYVRGTLEALGAIDGFFNNAGVEGRQDETEDYPVDEFDRVVSINLRGVFLGLQKVLPIMRKQGHGAIVNSASVGGIRGIGRQSGYAASKHGVVGLTRNSGVEHPHHGVRINAIAPGAIWTPMVEAAFVKVDPVDPQGAGLQFLTSNPMRRFGQPEEVANVVAFLLCDASSFINAAVIPIDGGQSAAY